MSGLFNGEYFNYYGGGTSYDDKETWYPHFCNIADSLIETFHPKTVLEVGCAFGYLVEAFREKGVEAYGMDISEHAVNNVADAIKPYCVVSSITEPLPEKLPEKYDLVIAIEILEHLHEEDSDIAIANLCKYSDTIIFSSTPDETPDITHYNVQQSHYWIKRFAKHMFFHDVALNFNNISSQAMCLYKTSDMVKVAADYEYHYRFMKNEVERLLPTAEDNNYRSTIYYDCGEGFLQTETFTKGNSFCQEFSFINGGAIALRFDPTENTGCIVENLEIVSNLGKMPFINANGFEFNGYHCFLTNDPQIVIPVDNARVTFLIIRAEIYPIKRDRLLGLLSSCQNLLRDYQLLSADRNIYQAFSRKTIKLLRRIREGFSKK